MKLLHFVSNGQVRLGALLQSGVYDLADCAMLMGLPLPASLNEAMAMAPEALRAALDLLERSPSLAVPESSVIYAPCVPPPQKLLCIGLNYHAHVEESHMPLPMEPLVFGKFANSLSAHRQAVPMPQNSRCIDYEAELVMVVGRRAKDLPEAEALGCIFGYTVGNDLSARDLQMRTGQWLIGKSLDGFAPVGPYVVPLPPERLGDLAITCRVNGELRQSGNTGDMIFSCARIVSHLSHLMTLEPGDLIFTGTPAGVAMGYPEGSQPWLKAGDQVVCEIEGIGKLTTYLV